MKQKIYVVSIIMVLTLSFALFGCGEQIADEYRSIYASSIEELARKIQEDQNEVASSKKGTMSYIGKGPMDQLLYPEIQTTRYVLSLATMNPYRVLYYYQPVSEMDDAGHAMFDYATGIVVGVSREKNDEGGAGAIQVIAKQLGAQISQDGSVYDVGTKTLYFPTEDAFYYIRMPGDCACTEDDIRELFVMKIQDLS